MGQLYIFGNPVIGKKGELSPDCEPGSSVFTVTVYGLDGPGIESRWGARFSAPVQTDPGAHPASCTMGTGSFQGVKNDRGVTLITHRLLMPWSRKSRAKPLLPHMGRTALYRASVLVQGSNFTNWLLAAWVPNTVHFCGRTAWLPGHCLAALCLIQIICIPTAVQTCKKRTEKNVLLRFVVICLTSRMPLHPRANK